MGFIPITLLSLGLALLILIVMVIATRQLPAFLEITLLQRLGMSQGSRYTVVTLSKYTVVAVGVAWIFGALGGSWSEIQWIFAALGVGIGFGLQEIVANFISGIILLFEQPIRVGDVVTVDNTTGTVSRIRIRATTIVNWERQELVIPNKSFITGQLINWTLSDTVNRLLITVGVSYDTDTRKAMDLMAEVAAEHPKVLDEPAPRISFEGFGDNALTLNMRAYLNDIDAAIQNYIRREHGIAVGERTAEEIKMAIGSADPTPDENQAEVAVRVLSDFARSHTTRDFEQALVGLAQIDPLEVGLVLVGPLEDRAAEAHALPRLAAKPTVGPQLFNRSQQSSYT